MCLLVKVAPNTEFPREWFTDCFRRNGDGFGLSYVGPDKTIIAHKTLPVDAEAAYDFWKDHRPTDVEYALHWRMRTHGAIDVERVHPYPVNKNIALMHNGVLSISGDTTTESDTQIYARTYAKALAPVLHEPLVQRMIAGQIGNNNRFIFITAKHGLIVINESTGVTTDKFPGCWFSNTYAWTPGMWGVKGYGQSAFTGHRGHSGNSGGYYPGYQGGRGYGVMGGIDGYGDDDDAYDSYWRQRGQAGTQEVLDKTTAGVGKPPAPAVNGTALVVSNAMSGRNDEAPEMAGDSQVLRWLKDLFQLAAATRKHDAAADRFLRVFDDEKELLAVLPDYFTDAQSAATELQACVQYLQAGVADFDDMLEIFSNEETIEVADVDQADDNVGDPADAYVGHIRERISD